MPGTGIDRHMTVARASQQQKQHQVTDERDRPGDSQPIDHIIEEEIFDVPPPPFRSFSCGRGWMALPNHPRDNRSLMLR